MEILSTSLKSWTVIIFKSYDEYFRYSHSKITTMLFIKIYKIPSIVPMAMTNSKNFIITQPFKTLWVVQDLGLVPNYIVSNKVPNAGVVWILKKIVHRCFDDGIYSMNLSF